jgi:hypothetical protein
MPRDPVDEALVNVERAARKVDSMFGGTMSRWMFDGKTMSVEASDALLGLHDYLNDVSNAREAEAHG